ncbi:MAG: stage V sporulation protein AA [Lachnospiraceae bacterium]
MSSTNTVYLNISQNTEVRTKDVFLKDVAKVYCSDTNIQNKCNALKLRTIREEKPHRYVENVLDVIKKLEKLDPSIQINNVGEVDFIIDYIPPVKPNHAWQWIKAIFVSMVSFCGAAFAIMTFNNDSNASDVFSQIHMLITGTESNGFTIIEFSYSIGLGIGIILFFNHFAKWKLNTDPSPLEVEMRLYEENVSKTLIQNDGRKEQEIDVQ